MTTLMRRTLLTTATAAGLAAVAAPAEAVPSASGKALIGKARKDQLHVMTFNIRMDNSTNTQPGDADHWPERRPLLVELLEREQPTLLGVQEAKYSQIGALEEALPKHRMIGYGRQGGSRDEYSAILYDATRLEVLAWDQFWLSDTPDVIGSATWGNTVTRIVTWAHLRDLRSGTELVHVNTHFDHRSEEARIRSGEAIAALLEDEELTGLPLILTGDFNSPAQNSGAYTTLVTDGPLLDTWDSAEERLTPAWGTFPGYEDPVEGNDRIDWICTSEGVRALRTAINVWRDADGRYPSDHAPVQTLIALL